MVLCKTKKHINKQIYSVIHVQDITFDQLTKFTIDIYKPIWKEHNGNQKSDSVVDQTIRNPNNLFFTLN